jgi:hypothetical protein
VLQPYRSQSLRSSFFMSALPEVDHGQTDVRFWTVSVNFESTLERAPGVFNALAAEVSFADAKV